MKTITFTIKISEDSDTAELSIKSSIQQQIDYHLKQKELAEQQIKTRVHELFKVRDSLLEQLNKELGADAWFVKNKGEYYPSMEIVPFEKSLCVSIGFRDGIYKNTPYNDWDIYVSTPLSKKIVYGNIEYCKPKLDEVKLYLIPTERKNKKEYGFVYYKEFKDLSEVHSLAEKDYITYFTNLHKESTLTKRL